MSFRPMTSRIEIHDGRVIKRYAPGEMEALRDKYSLLFQAQKSPEIFLVTPVGEAEEDGALAFPEVTGLKPIDRALFGAGARGAGAATHVIDLCAKALALIHSVCLKAYAGRSLTTWSHPDMDSRDEDGNPVLLHGDFGFSNLFLVPASDAGRLVVIDAEANGYFSAHHLEAGSRYVDLALMTSCLLGRLGACRSLLVASNTCQRYIHTLAASYEHYSGFEVSLPRLRDYTSVCVHSYFARRFANRRLTALASQLLLNRFRFTTGSHSR